MRDARPQSREECGARRNRSLARRRSGGFAAIDSAIADACWRLACAIVLTSLAFIVWNVGTRSPLALARDIRRTGRNPRALFLGAIAFVVGLIFFVAALVLVIAIVDFEADLWPTLALTFLVALAIELLVGPDVRRLALGDDRIAHH